MGDTGATGAALFADLANTSKAKIQPKRQSAPAMYRDKGKGVENADEVIEDMSPGGHINKRRARSRPVSRELQLLSASSTPAHKNTSVSRFACSAVVHVSQVSLAG